MLAEVKNEPLIKHFD